MPELHQTFEVATAQTSGPVNLFFFVKLFFFYCEYPFIHKPMVITKLPVASARLLGLGLKLYPSKMLHMLNKDLTQFMQSLS